MSSTTASSTRRWYVDLLDGGVVSPESGAAFDQSVTGDALGLDKDYWHPEHRQFEELHGGLDKNDMSRCRPQSGGWPAGR